MTIVKVEPQGHWATTTVYCPECRRVTTHVYLIGTVDGLSCRCGAPAYSLGWEVMTEPEDDPTPN